MAQAIPHLIVLSAILTHHTTLFGVNVGDKRVSKAFQHVATGNMVIEVEEYIYDAAPIRESARYQWHTQEGAGGLYFGNQSSGFYKLLTGNPKGLCVKGVCEKIRYTIVAPMQKHLRRKAEMVLDFEILDTNKDGLADIAGNLNVTCEGRKVCFASSNATRNRLTQGIVNRQVALHELQPLREIAAIYQFKAQPQKYLVIESEHYPTGYDRVAVMTSEGGTPVFLTVTDLAYEPNVNDLYAFNDGSKIYFDQNKKTYVIGNESATLLKEEQVSLELLEKLGLSNSRYVIPPMQTPCGLIFQSTETN